MNRRLPTEQELASIRECFRTLVFEQYGERLDYSKKAEWLAQTISDVTKQRISANTLRRFLLFGKQRTTPQHTTLDTLAAYVGFEAWEKLLEHWQHKAGSEELLIHLSEIKQHSPQSESKPKLREVVRVMTACLIAVSFIGLTHITPIPYESHPVSVIGFQDTLIGPDGILEVQANAPEIHNMAVRFRGLTNGTRNHDGVIGDNITAIGPLLPHTNFSYDFWVFVEDTIRLLPGIVAGYDSIRAAKGGQNVAIFPSAVTENNTTYRGSGVSVGTNGIQIIEHEHFFFDVRLSVRIPLTGWNHVYVVYQNNAPSLYVNGRKMGEAPPAPNRVYSSCLVGANAPYVDYLKVHFNGMVDEYRLWDTTMTSEQVGFLWNKKSHGRLNHLAIQWSFDDGLVKNLNLLSPFENKPIQPQSFSFEKAELAIEGILWGYNPYNPVVLPIYDTTRYLWSHSIDSTCVSESATAHFQFGQPFHAIHLRYLQGDAIIGESAIVRKQ